MISFQNVSFGYQTRPILQDVSLFIPAGSFHFLTGPSGSGKTTFFKLCALEQLPDQGMIEVAGANGLDMTRSEVTELRRLIGFVQQEAMFIDHLSVFDNVLLPVITAGLDPETEHENVAQLLDWVGLSERVDALPPELSGGERQRVALARAVILAPEIILADEPTGNIDWEMAQKLLELLIQLHNIGKTVLIATHDMNLVRAARSKVQTRILRLHQGQIHIAGSDL